MLSARYRCTACSNQCSCSATATVHQKVIAHEPSNFASYLDTLGSALVTFANRNDALKAIRTLDTRVRDKVRTAIMYDS